MATTNPIRFLLNNKEVATSLPPGMVMLDFLRHEQGLTGTKEGCREGDCGACMILLGELLDGQVHYKPVTSCLLPLGDIGGKHVVTIEGLNAPQLTPIQQALVDESAIQCGFCTPGIVIALTGFFINSATLQENDAIAAMDGNICRCTGYISIKRAARLLSERYASMLQENKQEDRLQQLVQWHILPEYFLTVPQRLAKLQHPAAREQAKKRQPSFIVAGGTDLFVQKPDELVDKKLTFLSQQKDLKFIRIENNRCLVGAGVTVEELRNSNAMRQLFPRIDEHFRLISSTPIRHRATVGGNIVNASPIGDLIVFFLALDAIVVLRKGNSRREVLLKDFYQGYKKLAKEKDEIIETIHFAIPHNASFNFEKVSKRTFLDIASVNSAMLLGVDNGVIETVHLSAGGVAPIPLYLRKTVQFLQGKKIDGSVVRQASEIALSEIAPISDVRGQAEYKSLLLRQLVFAHFIMLCHDYIHEEVLP